MKKKQETQFGFKNGLPTPEALFSMKLLVHKCYKQRKVVLICFIDYQKGFDNVKHQIILQKLNKIGLDVKDMKVIQQLSTIKRQNCELPEV